jgi:hypothetical protein
VGQVLREVALGRRVIVRASPQTWDELYAGIFMVDIEGWSITIFNDCDELDYCEACVSPGGWNCSFDSGDRFGADPVTLLSTWEHQTLERMLKRL